MKIGVFFRIANPPPWERDWHQMYQETLEEVEFAEEMGFDFITTTEHHFSADGYSPSPLIFEAAAAARTKRVELLNFIILLPLYHPLRFAEDAAMIDIISGGRLNLAVAPGYRHEEFDGFGVPREHSGKILDEEIEILVRAFTEDKFNFDGQFFKLRDVSLQPKPYQKPRPPIATGLPTTLAAMRRTAKWGLHFSGRPTAELYSKYLEYCKEYGTEPIAQCQTGRITGLCVEDPEKAFAENKRYGQWLWSYYRDWHWTYGRTSMLGGDLREEFTIGDPDFWIKEIKANMGLEGPPISHYHALGQTPGIPHETMMSSIELFGSKVLPHVKELAP